MAMAMEVIGFSRARADSAFAALAQRPSNSRVSLAGEASATDPSGCRVNRPSSVSVTNSGAVYVFVRDGAGVWSQQTYVKASNTEAGDQFGERVALSDDGSTLAVDAEVGDDGVLTLGADLYRVHLDYSQSQNGVDTLYHFASADVRDPDQRFLLLRPDDVEYHLDDAAVNLALHGAYEMHAGRFTLEPGLRYAYSGFSGRSALAPRLRARYRLPPHTALTLATGVYHQTPLNGHIVAHPDNRSLRDERSVHLIGGVTHQLSEDITATVEAYYKRLDDLVTPAGGMGRALTNDGSGWSSGIDAMGPTLASFVRR